jgi:superfamily II RNA helicase
LWAKKTSFLAIKDKFPGLEEGLVIKVIMEVKKICKTVKEMAILIGDVTLGQRMDTAAELLDRPIMSTQSLYFQ